MTPAKVRNTKRGALLNLQGRRSDEPSGPPLTVPHSPESWLTQQDPAPAVRGRGSFLRYPHLSPGLVRAELCGAERTLQHLLAPGHLH